MFEGLFARARNGDRSAEATTAQLKPVATRPTIGLALGGGAGRGFAFFFSDNRTPKVVGVTGVSDEEATAMARGLTPQLKDLAGVRLLRGAEVSAGVGWPNDLSTVAIFPLRYHKSVKGAIVIGNPPGQDFPLSPPYDNLLFLAEQAALGFGNACRHVILGRIA